MEQNKFNACRAFSSIELQYMAGVAAGYEKIDRMNYRMIYNYCL